MPSKRRTNRFKKLDTILEEPMNETFADKVQKDIDENHQPDIQTSDSTEETKNKMSEILNAGEQGLNISVGDGQSNSWGDFIDIDDSIPDKSPSR